MPGDVITTGTPPGVGMGIKPQPQYLKAGDVMELGIDKLGTSASASSPARASTDESPSASPGRTRRRHRRRLRASASPVAGRLLAGGRQVAIWDRDAARAGGRGRPELGGLAVRLGRHHRPGGAVEAAAKPRSRKPSAASTSWSPAPASPARTRRSSDYPLGCLAAGHRRQPQRALPLQPRRGAAHDRRRLRAHRQHRLGRRQGRQPQRLGLLASKAAVIGLTKSLGKELAKTGITVNCVTPAAVKTAIFDQMTAAHIDYMLSKIPMGRFGKVEEIAALVCWLASEECSFTTGAGLRHLRRPRDLLIPTAESGASGRRRRARTSRRGGRRDDGGSSERPIVQPHYHAVMERERHDMTDGTNGTAKVAVVTGGGTGIGKAMTRALAAAGWSVAITGRRAEVLEATAAELSAETGATIAAIPPTSAMTPRWRPLRRGDRAFRPARSPRQQCRRQRAGQAARGADGRRVEHGRRRQPHRRLPLHQGGGEALSRRSRRRAGASSTTARSRRRRRGRTRRPMRRPSTASPASPRRPRSKGAASTSPAARSTSAMPRAR